MEIGFTQEQKQSQAISPLMVQSLEILRMPITELRDVVLEEGLKNPTIETIDNYGKHFQTKKMSNETFIENIASSETLEEHILAQSHDLNQSQKNILKIILSNLNERGFFEGDISNITKLSNSNEQDVIHVQEFLKTLTPYGIGSSNLQECLLIQLAHFDIENRNILNFTKKIIENHFTELLASKFYSFKKLSSEYNIKMDEFKKFFSKLDFSPAAKFRKDDNFIIIPDIIVTKINNKWHIDIQKNYIPSIRLSSNYKNLILNEKSINQKEIKQLKSQLNHGKFLSNAIKQREQTLLKIANSMLEFQISFFENGISEIKKMTLSNISELTQLNISTISRAVNNKYIHTPHGMFALSTLFSSGSKSSSKASSTAIKEHIKIILSENKQKNLTDQAICDQLKEKNIIIARRTVTKYREQLKIANSRIRNVI